MPRDGTFGDTTHDSATTDQIDLTTLYTQRAGSNSTSSPQSGVETVITDAISDGYRFIDLYGAWSWDSDITIQPWNYVPFGITIDTTYAWIEYPGSGTALTVDYSGNHISEQSDGATFNLYGGFWKATGTPSEFLRGKDLTFGRILPRAAQDWSTDGSTTLVTLEAVDRWCEANWIFLRNHTGDVTLRGLDTADPTTLRTSFQDNTVWNLHAGNIQNGAAAIELEGSWLDCLFVNPTGITSSENAALFDHKANMQNSVVLTPEFEDGASNLSNYYLVRLSSDSGTGPSQLGGLIESGDGVTRFDDSSGQGSFSWHALGTLQNGKVWRKDQYSASGQTQRWEHRGGGMFYGTASDINGAFTDRFRIRPSGDVDLQSGGRLRDPVNSTTADSMTADPETAAEDGYIEVTIGGTDYQVPIYAP